MCQCSRSGLLKREDAQKMLGFCTNCGPSFLFGVIAIVLENSFDAAVLWWILISSAMTVGTIVLSGSTLDDAGYNAGSVSIPEAINRAIRSVVCICAWVIMSRILLHLFVVHLEGIISERWIVILSGVIELTNGCTALSRIQSPNLRFILAAVFTGFGGICVFMQVKSICEESDLCTKSYLPQKLIQAALCAVMAGLYGLPGISRIVRLIMVILFPFAVILLERMLAFLLKMLYNGLAKGGMHHAVS